MGNLLAYSGTATKIRGMRRKLLTAKDFQHLASLTSVSDAIGFLKTKSAYAGIFANSNENSLHRGEIEKMLTNAIYTDFQSIYRFATIHQRKILDLYFRRYEIGLLKTCMRMVFDHRDVELNFDIFKDFFEKHSDINLTALSNCKTLDEFVSLLKGSIYYRPLSLLSGLSEPTLWDYEMALDLCYFKWRRAKLVKREADEDERIGAQWEYEMPLWEGGKPSYCGYNKLPKFPATRRPKKIVMESCTSYNGSVVICKSPPPSPFACEATSRQVPCLVYDRFIN